MCPLLMTCCLVNTVCDTTVCWPSFGGLPHTYTAMAWINVACLHWCYVDVQHAGNLHLYTCWITPLSFGFVSIRREYFMSFFPRRKSKQMRMRILKIGRAGHGRRNVSKSGGGAGKVGSHFADSPTTPGKKNLTSFVLLCSWWTVSFFELYDWMKNADFSQKILESGGHGPPAPSPVPTPMELAKKRASKSKGSQMMPLNTSATCRSSKHQTWHLPVRSTLCNPSVKGRVRLGTILWILQSQPQKWMYLLLVLS